MNKVSLAKVGTPLRYPGGKTRALEQIAAMLPNHRFPLYVEPMVGGGSVFLMAFQRGIADSYWINDLYDPVYAFWKTIQDEDLNREMRDRLGGTVEAIGGKPDRAKALFAYVSGHHSSDMRTLARDFFFINRATFSGVFSNGGFSREASVKRFTMSSVERLEPMVGVLRGVKITHEDVLDLIPKIPEGSFVFLDPPYVSAKNLYGNKGGLHNEFPHDALAEVIGRYAHKFSFLMTYDSKIMERKTPRSIYKNFSVQEWSLRYSMDSWACSEKAEAGTHPDKLMKNHEGEKEWRKDRTKVRDAKTGREIFVFNYRPRTPKEVARSVPEIVTEILREHGDRIWTAHDMTIEVEKIIAARDLPPLKSPRHVVTVLGLLKTNKKPPLVEQPGRGVFRATQACLSGAT
jgi:DNA adenine methylase